MKDLRLYHWGSAVVTGTVFLTGVGLLMVPRVEIETVLAAESGKIVTGGILGAVLAYAVGDLFWGFGYAIRCVHLWPFSWSWRDGRLHVYTYRGWRVERTDRYLNSLGQAPVKYYHVFGLQMVWAIEQFANTLGHRIAREWEHIGMLQALGVVYLLLGIGTLTWTPQHPAIVWGTWRVPGAVSVLAVAWLMTGYSYRYRNAALVRDVANAIALRTRFPPKAP